MVFAEPMAVDWVGLVLRCGELGVLAHLVLVTAPKIMADQRAERDQAAARHDEQIKLLQAAFEQRNSLVVSALHEQTRAIVAKIETLAAALRHGRGPHPLH